VSVAAYASDTFQSEIEGFGLKTGFLKEWDEKRAETAVYVER
jgi:hypothetical protein